MRDGATAALGRITDTLEQDLTLRLVGPVAGLRVLDVGCDDGQLALEFASHSHSCLMMAQPGVRLPVRQARTKAFPES